jgi:hypothetical protein
LDIDKEAEDLKLQNPFFGLTFLAKELKGVSTKPNEEAYFTDNDIEKLLNIPGGSVHRLTSSFMLSYEVPGKDSKQLVDLGLNLKNYYKNCHVADYVRCIVVDEPKAEENKG